MTAELKPCPFCGVEASEFKDRGHSTAYNVGCFNGDCTIEPNTWADTKAEAIAAWNTRAMPAINPAAIREAALREAMDACTYVIKNIDILKADGETYETPRIQKIARGLVDVARQQIEALIGEKK